jgi:transposase
VIADAAGRAIAFRLAPGQAHALPQALPLLDALPGVPSPSAAVGSRLCEDGSAGGRWVVADRGHASHGFRQHIWEMGARPAIPAKSNEAPVACPSWIYHNRNRVERLWARLKEWRAVATRYEKTACSFMGVLCLAAALDWLRN